MSVPKNRVKQQKLARKRQRKQKARLKHHHKRPEIYGELMPIDLPLGVKFHNGAVGGIKMSEVLEEFVEPFAHLIEDDERLRNKEAYRNLFMLGTLAWNAALRPMEEREEMIADALSNSLAAESQWMQMQCRQIVDELVARKFKHFAEYKRPILEFVLEDRGNTYHLSVISAIA
jgi:hypothetical protein